jgi:hypothetical protein
MSTPSFFTELLPKRPEVTGTPNQVFSFAEDFGTMVLKLIQTKTIANLGCGHFRVHYFAVPL